MILGDNGFLLANKSRALLINLPFYKYLQITATYKSNLNAKTTTLNTQESFLHMRVCDFAIFAPTRQ